VMKSRKAKSGDGTRAQNSAREIGAEGKVEGKEAAAPATSAARFNYTLQTRDMSKSDASYRLRHLLKVSSTSVDAPIYMQAIQNDICVSDFTLKLDYLFAI
ncbi:hypothetical protein PV325_007475, partial [Microctonus aethiopoides]